MNGMEAYYSAFALHVLEANMAMEAFDPCIWLRRVMPTLGAYATECTGHVTPLPSATGKTIRLFREAV
jgi:hypothetical protein